MCPAGHSEFLAMATTRLRVDVLLFVILPMSEYEYIDCRLSDALVRDRGCGCSGDLLESPISPIGISED